MNWASDLTMKGRKDEVAVSRQFAHLFKQM